MTALIASLLAATAGPTAIDDAYRALLSAREPARADVALEHKKIEQPYFAGLDFFYASGWSHGGHRRLTPYTLAVRDGALHVVVPELENVDDDGHVQRLKALWLCPLAHVVETLKTGDDVTRLMKLVDERKTACTGLAALAELRFVRAFSEKQPRAWLDGFAAFLAALVLDAPEVRPLKALRELDPALAALFKTRDAGHTTAWVNGAVDFAPWGSTSTARSYAGLGMVLRGTAVDLIEVRYESKLSMVRKSVAFARVYIE